MPELASYTYNNGGLNNQKLTLLGLFLEAKDKKRPLVLPNLFNLHVDQTGTEVSLRDIYRLEPLHLFAQVHGIEICNVDPSGNVGGWDYFLAGRQHIALKTITEQMTPDDISCDFFRHMLPMIRDRPEVRTFHDELFERRGVSLVIQMRIEQDWQKYFTSMNSSLWDQEDVPLTFTDIMTKTVNSLGDDKLAYVVCDEENLPVSKAHIRQACLEQFGVALLWKSDLLDTGFFNGLSILERSLVDFDVASAAERFVGLSRSSFSNLVTFERYATRRQNVRGHYIYNTPDVLLSERFDNGAFAQAEAATRRTRAC